MISIRLERVKPDTGHGALFLDRDGTLIEHVPYLHDPAQIRLLEGVREGLEKARRGGFLLFLFTNQSGVGRGYFPLDAALACNAAVVRALGMEEPVFAAECTAPEHPDAVPLYRKPSPRFINEMVERFCLDRHHCWMIGDQPVDVETARSAGIRGFQVGVDGSFAEAIDLILGEAAQDAGAG